MINTNLYTFLLVCSVLLSGCGQPGHIPEDLAPEKEPAEVIQIPEDEATVEEPPEMIQIQKLTLADNTLILDYQVSNPFEKDIRVCHDTWVHGKQNVQDVTMRIDGDTVCIKLLFNIENTFPGFVNPPAIAKYVRLQPGESCSGRILLDLPIRDYSREWQADPKKRKQMKEREQIVLHRTVFEIGYLRTIGPKWEKLLDSWSEKFKEEAIKPKPRIIGPYCYLPTSPFVTEETLDGQLREVLYLQDYTSLEKKEEFAQVVITDFAIPCSVVVDDK